KSDARGERVPRVIDQTLRNSVPPSQAYSIQVELDVRQRNTGDAGESGTVLVQGAARKKNRRLRRVVEVGIEIRQPVCGVIGVGKAFPTQAQVQCEPVRDAPVVQGIQRNGVIGYLHEILNRRFVVRGGEAEQEIRKPVAGGR